MKFLEQKKKRIYLDYAAATPIRLSVLEAMKPYWRDMFANAGAIHTEGVQVRKVIEEARAKLARILKIRPSGVVFTGSGTESNNLAILGVIENKRVQGISYTDMEVVSTKIEHPSVLKALEYVETLGVTIRYMEIDTDGLVITESLYDVLNEKTVMVTFSYANSEIGVVQHVGKLVRLVRAGEKKFNTSIVVHVDAAQAPLWLPCQMNKLLVDILTFDAGKCYGPKGVGVLAMRHGVRLSSVMYGGGQERGLRPATENTAGIIGAVEALCIAQEGLDKRVQKVSVLRNHFCEQLLQEIEGVLINGSRTSRIANNINISIPGIDSEFAVVSLDIAGVACSTKSACSGAEGGGSSVIQEITHDTTRAMSSIRFSLGEETTSRELKKTVAIVRSHVLKIRSAHTKLTRG